MKTPGKIVLLVLGIVALLLLGAIAHTWFGTPDRPIIPRQLGPTFNLEAAAGRLGNALQFRTESLVGTSAESGAEFERLHAFLREAFPRVHAQLRRETVNRLSLLYTWPGRNPALKTVLLMSHQDVVPVSPGSEGAWKHPPFSGAVADGAVWGRGALDMKSSLMGQLEAAELLLAAGWSPECQRRFENHAVWAV